MSANERRNGGPIGWRGQTGLGLVLFGGVLAGVAWAQPRVPGLEPIKKQSVEEWRKQFPFVSLTDRLEYEAKRAKGEAPPALSADAKKRLETEDRGARTGLWGNLRLQALQKLHSREAADFVKREGFGLDRMPRTSPRYLELPGAPTIPQGKVGYDEAVLQDDPRTTLPKTGAGMVGPARLPSVETLAQLHDNGRYSFLLPDSFGLVKTRKEVSGFEPHQFRFSPADFVLNPPARKDGKKEEAGKERWVMKRLELVSVWKFDTPAVYVSDRLPRMQDLGKAPRRALSDFEAKGLKKLQAGEDLVTEASTNRIHMLGALRASKQCLQCHDVQRGALLGSFSYELLRDPPLNLR
jgi:hypothetical protein